MELKINKVNSQEFQNFIKKLLSIDKFIFMKMDKKDTSSAVYLPQRDAVKMVKVDTTDLFEIEGSFDDNIKVSFFNGTRIMDALSQFTADDVKGKIIYDTYGEDLVASDFIIYNDNLEINLMCADPSLDFMDMSTEEVTRAFSTAASLFDFDISTTQVDQINSLFKLDKEHDTFTLQVGYNSKDGVYVKGDNYNSVLTEDYSKSSTEPAKVTIYKKYLPLLDKESYKATVCNNKIVFKSDDTETLLTIAVCMTDEDDE